MLDIRDIILSEDEARMLLSITRDDERWKGMKERKSRTLLSSSRLFSIGSSLRIEGGLLPDYDLERVLNGAHVSSASPKDKEEAISYARAYDYIEENADSIEISSDKIKSLHAIMMGRSLSAWRESERVKQNILQGEASVERAKSYKIEEMMEAIISDYHHEEKRRPSLLSSLLFMLRFLSVNPFEEGNGRMSRLLFRLLSLRGGYEIIRAIHFERELEMTKKTYLLSVRRSQVRRETTSFFSYMLEILSKGADRVIERISENTTEGLSPLEERILGAIESQGKAYTQDILHRAGEAAPPTVKKALQSLRKKGLIAMYGKARGTWYETI